MAETSRGLASDLFTRVHYSLTSGPRTGRHTWEDAKLPVARVRIGSRPVSGRDGIEVDGFTLHLGGKTAMRNLLLAIMLFMTVPVTVDILNCNKQGS